MSSDVYRYHFGDQIPAVEVETTLILSIFGTEALHGEAQTRLDAGHAFDAKKRTVVIDAGTPVGRDLNRLFIGFMTREFGSGSFRVARVERPSEPKQPQPETVTA
ncbi:hypothetical protein J8F10_06180 [Gemmata sp. G18]|uniref:DUF3467 domain-containing protein n=1 Tax=Gemmata palustris TaxID=2822762 RepID=A0ABS5BMB9_9BACT|nr:hypothetical protein [Gemmata palustris]MBP3954869.1 hypothetical protein [Gemmata palustris]